MVLLMIAPQSEILRLSEYRKISQTKLETKKLATAQPAGLGEMSERCISFRLTTPLNLATEYQNKT